ncbi:MAG: hypothetical protein ACPGID_02805 [Rubricella sp.]
MLFKEDDQPIGAELARARDQGFARTILIGAADLLPEPGDGQVQIEEPVRNRDMAVEILNTLMPKLAGRWVAWSFGGEFLFFPFCETRKIDDFTAFLTEEKRDAAFTYVIDLYAGDLDAAPSGMDIGNAFLDRSGYYGFQRFRDGAPLDRQFDIFGGLGWRMEQYIPWDRRRIDRVSLFRARPGLEMRPDLTLSDEEMNTIACPWHHNPTIALASFRIAKSLKRNPGSTYEIGSFMWRRSERFEWSSEHLMRLGFIEPGQWF